MHRVKMFFGTVEDLSVMESELNRWLEVNDGKIVSMAGNFAPPSTPFAFGKSAVQQFPPEPVLVMVAADIQAEKELD